jgi:hypothetical protein
MAKIAKAQMGKPVAKKKAAVDSVESEMNPGKMIPKSAITKGPYITPKKSAPKKKMKSGGALKPVAADQKGLSKLPTAVRNKMGYQKNGGKASKMMMMGGKCKYGCK